MDTRRRSHRTFFRYERVPGIPTLLLPELWFARTQIEPQWTVLGRTQRLIGFRSGHETPSKYLLGRAGRLVCFSRSNSQA